MQRRVRTLMYFLGYMTKDERRGFAQGFDRCKELAEDGRPVDHMQFLSERIREVIRKGEERERDGQEQREAPKRFTHTPACRQGEIDSECPCEQ